MNLNLIVLIISFKQNMHLNVQMLAGKEAKTFFERFSKNLPSLGRCLVFGSIRQKAVMAFERKSLQTDAGFLAFTKRDSLAEARRLCREPLKIFYKEKENIV